MLPPPKPGIQSNQPRTAATAAAHLSLKYPIAVSQRPFTVLMMPPQILLALLLIACQAPIAFCVMLSHICTADCQTAFHAAKQAALIRPQVASAQAVTACHAADALAFTQSHAASKYATTVSQLLYSSQIAAIIAIITSKIGLAAIAAVIKRMPSAINFVAPYNSINTLNTAMPTATNAATFINHLPVVCPAPPKASLISPSFSQTQPSFSFTQSICVFHSLDAPTKRPNTDCPPFSHTIISSTIK